MKTISFSLSVITIFILVLLISNLTPMHSDDYAYYLKGLGIDSHINHYMTWSGRLVADYISTIILSFENHKIKALINSLGMILLVVLIIIIPKENKKIKSSDIITLFIIFFLYWLSNPNLGQTTFWIVGASNYLWTNLIILLFIFFLLRKRTIEKDNISYSLCILALVAGCTNENTGFIAILTPVLIFFFEKIKTGTTNKKFLYYSFFSFIGYIVLIASPGNSARSARFIYWNSISFIQKIREHFLYRVPSIIDDMWLLFLFSFLIILSACTLSVLNNNKDKLFAFAFSLFSVISISMMVLSPSFPPRAANGSLVFILLSISFILHDSMNNSKYHRLVISIIAICLGFIFSHSYSLMYDSYKRTSAQQEVRIKMIELAKMEGKKDIAIPDFSWKYLWRTGDKFDMYHDPYVYGKYYGVNKITVFPTKRDYSYISSENLKTYDDYINKLK
ncbi:DUF6056 family protein [Hafnia alvei]|uniref:DUF6056 family protein n=1 Tax=Hafnia alvei TaxID=569 RepID=UPI00345ECA34